MRIKLSYILLLIYISTLACDTYSQVETIEGEVSFYTSNLPFQMPEIKPPKFSGKNFIVSEFGAIGDGLFKNTEAFNKAIEECAKAGGGHVVVPAGSWLTGPIQLMSNVDLHLEKGALVIFSPDHNDYKLIQIPGSRTFNCQAPISGFNLENIAVTGEGLFDGNGQTWRPVKKSKLTTNQWNELISSGGGVSDDGETWRPTLQSLNAEKYLAGKKRSEMTKEDYEKIKDYQRPNLLYLVNCKNVLIDGITLQNSPRFHLYFQKSENGIIRNVKVLSEWFAQNGDGLDIISSKNVVMYNCTVNTGDDGLCMKSSGDNKSEPALQNIVIADCVVYHAHGGFVIGSNTDGGVKNISVRNCNFINTDIGLRFKSTFGRGGKVENIFIEDIYMKGIQNEAILFDMLYVDTGAAKTLDTIVDQTKIPIFQNFYLKNIFCNGAKQACMVKATGKLLVKNIHMENVVIKARKGFKTDFAQNFSIKDVKIIPEEGPTYSINQSKDIYFKNVLCPDNTNIFIKLSGKDTENIIIERTDFSHAKIPFEFSSDVDKKVLQVN